MAGSGSTTQTEGASSSSVDGAGGSRFPLIAGATFAAAAAGWVVVAGRNARARVLGVAIPWSPSRSPGEVVGAGVREVGRTLGGMPIIGRIGDRVRG